MNSVVLTQPTIRSDALKDALIAVGWDPVEIPMSAIVEGPDLDWPDICLTAAQSRWVLFPSPAAVAVVMAALQRHGLSWPPGPGIGLIGPGSREMLCAWQSRITGLAAAVRIAPDVAPFDAERLLARPELNQVAGDTVMVLRRADGREAWLHTLADRGAEVIARSVYRLIELAPQPGASEWFGARAAGGAGFALSIASADAGHRLAKHVSALPCADWLMHQPVMTQHPKIAQALRERGWREVREHPPGVVALVHALESLRKPRS
jgi:uroporphyrinogen-III synthase